jgi:nucleoside-diphosphate-sugar epimerase
MDTVLILGANGRFGAAAVQAFAAAGWHVLAQVRRAPATPLPARVEAVELPLGEPAALAERAHGASVVVYAVNPIYTRWDRELMPLFRQGLDVARRLSARFMLPGNVYNYGEGMPARLLESTPERPTTAKGRQRVEMEAELEASGLDGTVIRAGDFYGGGSGSWFDLAIVKDIGKGKLVYPGPLELAHAWAYLPDLAQAFVAVASTPPVRGLERLNFEGHTLTGREFLAALEHEATALGLLPATGFRQGGMPWTLLRVIGLVHPMMRELARMSYLWRVPHGLDGRALRRRAGPLKSTPLDVSMRQSLRDLGLGRSGALSLQA